MTMELDKNELRMLESLAWERVATLGKQIDTTDYEAVFGEDAPNWRRWDTEAMQEYTELARKLGRKESK